MRCCWVTALLQLVYIAFDLLFMGEESILTRPLHERQQLLAQVIKCVPADQPGIPCGAGTISGRVVALIPDQPVPLPLPNGTMTAEAEAAGAGGDMEASRAGSMPAVSCAALSELVFSRVGRSLADVQAMYDMALSRQVRPRCSDTNSFGCLSLVAVIGASVEADVKEIRYAEHVSPYHMMHQMHGWGPAAGLKLQQVLSHPVGTSGCTATSAKCNILHWLAG